MATQLAERRASPVEVIRQNIMTLAPEFRAALPAHVTVEKFSRVAMTAIQNTPDLADADRKSLFGAIVRLAQDGLLPDGREAALVIFKTKNKSGGWDAKVQAMPMMAGLLKKVRQSGDVSKVSARVVHEHDEFSINYGFDDEIKHVPPPLDKPRGKAIGAYAVAVLADGSRYIEVMSLEDIERVRAVSKSKDNQYGPWVQWWGEMARKTVFRRLSKWLPMSTDLEEAFSRDETLSVRYDGEPVQAVTAHPVSRLDALEHQIQGDGQEGPADSQRGESHTQTAYAAAVEEIRGCPTADAVDAALDRLRPVMETDDEAADLFNEAQAVKAAKGWA